MSGARWNFAGSPRGCTPRMHAAGEAPELIAATALLANPEIYRAAQAALREALARDMAGYRRDDF